MPRDLRSYITVHDGMPDHPKIAPLSDGAFRLLITSWCWSSRFLTDGVLPAAVWAKSAAKRVRTELVVTGLAVVQEDGTVLLHDYLEHQRSASEAAVLHGKRAAAGAAGGKQKASNRLANAVANAVANGQQTGSKALPELELELEKSKALADEPPAKPRKPRSGTAVPDEWLPTPERVSWAAEHVPRLNIQVQTEQWMDYHRAKGTTAKDWDASWRNWMRRAVDYAQARPPMLRAVGAGPDYDPTRPAKEW